MKFAAVAVPAALALSVSAQSALTINTPNPPVVCQPLLVTWTGGTGPYILSVHDGNNPNGAAVEELGTQQGTSFTWKVNLAPGSIGLKLLDSVGQTAQTSSFNILSGSDTSCVGQSVSGSGGSAAATGAPATTTAAGGSSAAAPTTSKPAGASSAGGSAASASASPNAAVGNVANVGLAGLVAAFFAIVA